MEPGKEGKPGEAEPAASFQARLWRNLQLGGKRRTAEPPAPPSAKGEPAAAGRWGGLRRRRQALDRVFSSSQPNLCCSAAEPPEQGGEAGSALRRPPEQRLPPGKAPPAARSTPAAPSARPGGDQGPGGGPEPCRRPGAHLSHQKSSSLPSTACLEQLLQGSPSAGTRNQAPKFRVSAVREGRGACRRVQHGATKVIKGLEHLSCEERRRPV